MPWVRQNLLAAFHACGHILLMLLRCALPLLLCPVALAAAPPPLSASQAEPLRCVAAIAIIANEQKRGIAEWTDFPDLADDGARYASIVTDRVADAARAERALVEREILRQIADIQRQSSSEQGSSRILHTLGEACVAEMERVLPQAPAPGLTRCAAMVALARDDARAREGMSKTVKDLTVFAAVLDSRARMALRADGKTDAESDIVIGTEREILADAFKDGSAQRFDFPSCFELAKP
jgi:hypothetical protein